MRLYNSNGISGTEQCGEYSITYLQSVGSRVEQQDCIGYTYTDSDVFAVLCDGMGGHKGGRQASQIAVEEIIHAFENKNRQANEETLMTTALESADQRICALADADGTRLNAGSTAVVCWLKGRTLSFASVGDSRLYLYRGEKLIQLSVDMIYRRELDGNLSAGIISQEEYDSEIIHGEELISFLGMGGLEKTQLSLSENTFENEDKLLLMSDGLYKLIENAELESIVKNFKNPEETLIALNMKIEMSTKRRGIRRDNLSVMLISVSKGGQNEENQM